jgi:hypothetical protein
MADPCRSASRRSTSMSALSRNTIGTHQPIPLITIRRKLLRQLPNTHGKTVQRRNQSKHDTEQLFKLYYSNDLQYDALRQEIVTGSCTCECRLVLTVRSCLDIVSRSGKRSQTTRFSSVACSSLINSSNNLFDSKLNVSREQLTPSAMNRMCLSNDVTRNHCRCLFI